jgi:hypothetical protein
VILTARLTRLYERRDWSERFTAASDTEPLLLERGITLNLKLVIPPEPAPMAKPSTDREMLERAHQRVMAKLEQKMPGKASPFTDLVQMRQARQARLGIMERD